MRSMASHQSFFEKSASNSAQEKNMTNSKLAAIAVLAITAAAAGSQVRGGAYDYPYTPTYSSYPVSGSPCPSGQCGNGATVPTYSYAPSYAPAYSYSSYAPGTSYGVNAGNSTGTCPNGCCGANGGCCANGCCANGRCGSCASGTCPTGTCPPGACQSGNCSANCPNGQCRLGRNRDTGTSLDDQSGPINRRADFAPAPRYTPTNWSTAPSARRNYDAGPVNRVNRDRELESPFYE
jgi:hypothetical protein